MPLQKLQFRPGVNRESTTYANEGGWFDIDKVRFRSGYPEKIGGWKNLAAAASTFKGVARTMWNWVTLAFSNLNAVGTNQKLYIESGYTYNDVTPLNGPAIDGETAGGFASGPLSTTNGSNLVTFTCDSAHGVTPGTYVTIAGVTGSGSPAKVDNIPITEINAEHEIISVPSSISFTFLTTTKANATSASTGGTAPPTATFQIPAGNSIYTTGNGWGAGTWGGVVVGGVDTGWGTASAVGVGQQLRLWSLDNYGQDLLAAPRGGAIYYWETPASTSSFPRAVTLKSIAKSDWVSTWGAPTDTDAETAVPGQTLQIIGSGIQRFVIAFGATPFDDDADTAFNPLLVRWSDLDNQYDWYPSTTNQSGDYTLTSGSTIIAARAARQENLIWTDSALYSMQYLGPPYVWGFNLLMDNISIISPNAIASANNVTYWMGVDKFYSYSGRVETLPCSLRQFIYDDINMEQAFQIVCGTNEGYNEIWWMYPSANSSVNDRYVIYNHLERIWYYGTINRTAWLDSPLRQYPMGAFSVQNSYLDTSINATQTSVTLLNGFTYPSSGTIIIGSEEITYTGHDQNDGNTLTGCTRGANSTTAASHDQYAAVTYKIPNQVMWHEYGVDDGSLSDLQAIEAYIQSSDFDIGDGHNFGFVWRMLPDVTFNGSSAATPSVTLTVRPRQNAGTPYGSADTPSVSATNPPNNYALSRVYNVQLFTGQVYTRIRGRQMAFKIESDGLGTTWQLGVPRIDIRPDGRR